jgi:hypothetical protein
MAPLEILRTIVTGATISRNMIDLLTKAYPGGFTKEALVTAVYARTRNGGPTYAENVIANHISYLRNILPSYGWDIPNYARSGHRYVLVPIGDIKHEQAVVRGGNKATKRDAGNKVAPHIGLSRL